MKRASAATIGQSLHSSLELVSDLIVSTLILVEGDINLSLDIVLCLELTELLGQRLYFTNDSAETQLKNRNQNIPNKQVKVSYPATSARLRPKRPKLKSFILVY